MTTYRLPEWLNSYLSESLISEFNYEVDSGILIHALIDKQNPGMWADSVFSERANVEYSTTWCEQELGEKLLNRALEGVNLSPDLLVLDLGCGDGRYVHAMLRRGAKKIIALNYELAPLRRLQKELNKEELSRVALVCGDINQNPFKTKISSFVIAWGLWTSTPDFLEAMQSTIDLVTSDGLLLNAEPVLEHALVYALIMGNHDEFMTVLETKSRSAMWGDFSNRYQVKTANQLKKLMEHRDLKLEWESGISVLPSLVFGGLLTQKIISEEQKMMIWNRLKNFETDWCRQLVYLSRKVS